MVINNQVFFTTELALNPLPLLIRSLSCCVFREWHCKVGTCCVIYILCDNAQPDNDIIFGVCVFVQLKIKLKPAVLVIIARKRNENELISTKSKFQIFLLHLVH